MVDYRSEAASALERAKQEMASGEEVRLKYAALELRMAMEALTYDRALAYRDEFPESEYDTWQPKKVMAVLLEIDGHADQDASFAIGEQPAQGEKPTSWHSLGTDTKLNMATIKTHYDALGSYLHVLTVRRHRESAPVDSIKMRARCERIAAALANVLSSTVWNMRLGRFATYDCSMCGARIRRRLSVDGEAAFANCRCGAGYDISQGDGGTFLAQLQQVESECPVEGCGQIRPLPSHMLKPGLTWRCEGCSTTLRVQLGIAVPDEVEAPN